MPNHVKNVLKFSNLSEQDKDFIVARFTNEFGTTLDFNAIIPEPKIKSECPEDCLVNKDSHVQEDKDRPWFNWYTWHYKYWGTKWGAYDGYIITGKTWVQFVFSTAWATPLPIYQKLAQKYNFKFKVRYADEDLGHNCGIIIYNKDDFVHLHEDEIHQHPRNFAERLWNTY